MKLAGGLTSTSSCIFISKSVFRLQGSHRTLQEWRVDQHACVTGNLWLWQPSVFPVSLTFMTWSGCQPVQRGLKLGIFQTKFYHYKSCCDISHLTLTFDLIIPQPWSFNHWIMFNLQKMGTSSKKSSYAVFISRQGTTALTFEPDLHLLYFQPWPSNRVTAERWSQVTLRLSVDRA